MNLSSSLSYIIPFYSPLSRGVMKPNRDSHSKPIAFDIDYVLRILKLWNPQAITSVASIMTQKRISDTEDYSLRPFILKNIIILQAHFPIQFG